MYAVFLHSWGKFLRFLLKKFKVVLAFLVIFVMWDDHFKFSVRVSPRYGFSSTCFRIWSQRVASQYTEESTVSLPVPT